VKLLREPLLHFLVAGVVLFGGYRFLNSGAESTAPAPPRQIRIGDGEVRWLTETWRLQRQREPTPDELRELVTSFIEEELLSRQAREMKLDENDAIVRRRLSQKLTFLIEGTSLRSEPTEEDMRRLYEADPKRFQTEGRVSFAHIFFSPASRIDPVSDATKARTELSGVNRDGAMEVVGDRFLLASEFHDEDRRAIVAVFGEEFAHTLFALQPDVWSGPVRSGYGVHLVRVSALESARPRPLAEVAALVRDEWLRVQEKAAKERYISDLRGKYTVVADDNVKRLLSIPARAAP